VAGDFDGDGKVDVAGGTSAGMAFLKGNGDGTFQAPVYSNPTYPFNGGLVEADISGDGKPDLISYPPQTTTLGGGAVAMVGNGDGTFGTLISLGATGIAAGWPSGDFNSDGVADLAMPNQDLSGSPATVVTLYLSAPVVNLFPNTLSFGAVTVGKTSKPQRLTLTNTGNAPLALSGITVSGDFLLSNRCGSSLAIGRSCAIQVTFKPSVKGLRTGTLNLSDDAAGSRQRARLSGTGN
jgi:hypothetical protein